MDMVGWERGMTKTLDPMKHRNATGLGKGHYCLGVGHLMSWIVSGCKHGEKLSNAIVAFKSVGKVRFKPRCIYISAMDSKWFGDYGNANYPFGVLRLN